MDFLWISFILYWWGWLLPPVRSSCPTQCGRKLCTADQYCETIETYNGHTQKWLATVDCKNLTGNPGFRQSLLIVVVSDSIVMKLDAQKLCNDSNFSTPSFLLDLEEKGWTLKNSSIWNYKPCVSSKKLCEKYGCGQKHGECYQSSCDTNCSPDLSEGPKSKFVGLFQDYLKISGLGAPPSTTQAPQSTSTEPETTILTTEVTTATTTVAVVTTTPTSSAATTLPSTSALSTSDQSFTTAVLSTTADSTTGPTTAAYPNSTTPKTTSQTPTTQTTTPSQDDDLINSLWWIALVAVFVIAVIAAVIAYICWKKRNRPTPDVTQRSESQIQVVSPPQLPAEAKQPEKKRADKKKKVRDQSVIAPAPLTSGRTEVDKLVVADPEEKDHSQQTTDQPWDKLLNLVLQEVNDRPSNSKSGKSKSLDKTQNDGK